MRPTPETAILAGAGRAAITRRCTPDPPSPGPRSTGDGTAARTGEAGGAVDRGEWTDVGLEDAFAGMPSLQRLIDSGAAWALDGAVRRAAERAIRDGTCVLGPRSFRDRWGILTPSRHDVGPDCPGSVAYANARRAERGLPPIAVDDEMQDDGRGLRPPPVRPLPPSPPGASPAEASARRP